MLGIGKDSVGKSKKVSANLEEQIRSVHASLNRCVANDTFISVFYNNLMGSDEEIRQKFSKTDFDKQQKLLRKALVSAITFAAGGEVARERLQAIRASHNRANLDIKPEFYPIWVNSLIQTITACDLQFNDRLEGDWRAVLKPTIDFLSSGYLDY